MIPECGGLQSVLRHFFELFAMEYISALTFDKFLEVLGFCVGILYLWWEYHADARVWVASVIMPAISMWIYFAKGLYADFGINIYYLIIAVYGFVVWTRGTEMRGKEQRQQRPIIHTPLWAWGVVAVSTGLLWGALWWILASFTDSTVPVADAFTTALSVVAMWMMARKYAEQWLAWLVVDVVCVGLYIYKGLVFYPALYAVYTVIAGFGYRKWLMLMKVHNSQSRH